MLDWLYGIEIEDLQCISFVLSPLTFVQLLEGEVDLSFFCTLSLPPQTAMEQAPSEVIDRLHAIKEVDPTEERVGFAVAGEA